MKLKQSPDDFQVEELSSLVLDSQGKFAFYRLEKRGWTTHDALAAVRRRWHIEASRLAYGGLKDRHAHTIQYFTIFQGPQRDLEHHNVSASYLGQVAEPFRSLHITANRFAIVLRDIHPGQVERIKQSIEEARTTGLPNYFDDQRFGSVGVDGEFIARLLVLGRFEEGLRRALATPYEFDSASEKKEKTILRRHWGDWPTCLEQLPRSHSRSLVDYLVHHPDDFRGAVARLRPDLRTLYLSAYQSDLWNRMLALWLRQHCAEGQLADVQLQLAKVPMPRSLPPQLRQQLSSLKLPLPSARLKLPETDARLALVQEVLREEDLELKQLQIKGIRELFFSKGERDAWLLPSDLRYEMRGDDMHSGKSKCTLWFDLPRGCYATMIVKRIMA